MSAQRSQARSATAEIGGRIRSLRLDRGLKLREISDQLGVTRACVSQWEAGRSAPPVRLIAPLAKLLSTSTAILMTGTEDDQRTTGERDILDSAAVILRARKEVARALDIDVRKVSVRVET